MKTTLTLFGLLGLALALVAGCEPHSDGRPPEVEKICINGVVYYNSGHKLAPAFHPDSTVIQCLDYTRKSRP